MHKPRHGHCYHHIEGIHTYIYNEIIHMYTHAYREMHTERPICTQYGDICIHTCKHTHI